MVYQTEWVIWYQRPSCTIADGLRGFLTDINSKEKKIIAWLEFELAYYDFAIQYVNHNTTKILLEI